MPIYKEIISEEEIYADPINEHIRVYDTHIAFEILRMDVCAMADSFLTIMHREMVMHMMQRGTMANHILMTPNICAELFTLEGYRVADRYIINKLVGRYDLNCQRIPDFDCLERQTLRKIKKLVEAYDKDYLLFFWNREPNAIYRQDGQWRFIPESPTYQSMLEFYGDRKLVKKS